jgi:hypothetical protein
MAFCSTLPLTALAAASALLFSCASPAPENLKPWDQGAASALGQQLAAATSDFWTRVVEDPEGGWVGSGDAEAVHSLQNCARNMNEQAEALAGNLRAGKGRAETLDLFLGVKEIADNCADDARQAFVPAPVQSSWNEVRTKIVELAQYYDTRALGDLQDRP